MAIRCVGCVCVYMCALVRECLCLLWCETHIKGLTARPSARPEVEEGRKVPEKTQRVSRQGNAEETSRREIEVQGKDDQ